MTREQRTPIWLRLTLTNVAVALLAVLILASRRRLLACRCLRDALGRRVVALEQRVLLDLALDERRQLEIGKLQQLDRLLQLRRHDERLGLPEIEPLRERHDDAYSPKPSMAANIGPTD